MGRPRRKPGYNPQKEIGELLSQAAAEYGSFDDRDPCLETGCGGRPVHRPSLNEVAHRLGLNVTKVRKLLITAGVYSTEVSRLVKSLHDKGASTEQIMNETGLSRSAVNSYIPYEKIVYKLNETSLNADRMKRFRQRRRAVEEFSEGGKESRSGDYIVWNGNRRVERKLWNAVILFEGYLFEKEDGLKFRYRVDDDGIHFTGMENAVTWEDVNKALADAAKPCRLEDEKASYLYPVLQKLGISAESRQE